MDATAGVELNPGVNDGRHLGAKPIAKMCEGKTRDGLLFGDGVDYLGRPRSSGASRSWFMTALDAAGLERMTVHDLRHTPASLAISSGANVKAVQRMLGHVSAAMALDVYADLFDDDLHTISASIASGAPRSSQLQHASSGSFAASDPTPIFDGAPRPAGGVE